MKNIGPAVAPADYSVFVAKRSVWPATDRNLVLRSGILLGGVHLQGLGRLNGLLRLRVGLCQLHRVN